MLLEETLANVWPSFSHMLYDGWLLRFTPGYSKRNNSVWPIIDGDIPLETKIAFCEQQYAARELSCSFRLTDRPGHDVIERQCVARGYIVQNPNLVMVCPLRETTEAVISELALDDWLETIFRIHPTEDGGFIDWERQVLQRLALPSHYVVIMRHEKACGYGRSVQQDRTLVIEDLWTLPELRGQGLGTQLIQGLFRLGYNDGAEAAVLTVNEPNKGARRLYERLGFTRSYAYRYLVQE